MASSSNIGPGPGNGIASRRQLLLAAALAGVGAVPFFKQAQAVFAQALQQLPKMEHPEAISEILNAYPNSRLISVDVPDISKLLNDNMAPFWSGKSDVKTATTAATQQIDSYQ